MTRSHGIDVSHHNPPDSIPWKHVAMETSFVYVRATYGKVKDRETRRHVERARGVGMRVGLYHFFRVVQDPTDQFVAFREVAEECGYGIGDLAPCLDIEDDPKVADVAPGWSDSAQRLTSMLREHFGECVVYITQRDFGRLGRPYWVLDRPLWVAHWTTAEEPAAPAGKPWALWQFRVGPYIAGGPGGVHNPQQLDHNWGNEPLPVCRKLEPQPDTGPGYQPMPTRFDAREPSAQELLDARLLQLQEEHRQDIFDELRRRE